MSEQVVQEQNETGSKITLFSGLVRPEQLPAEALAVSYNEMKGWVRRGAFLTKIFRYRQAELITESLHAIPKPVFAAWLLRLLSRGSCVFADKQGQRETITWPVLLGMTRQFLSDYFRRAAVLKRIEQETGALLAAPSHPETSHSPPATRALNLAAMPAYLRTDLWFGIKSGGSVGHIAGVANNLDTFCARPILLTTDFIPTVRDDIEMVRILPPPAFWDFAQLPALHFTDVFYARALEVLQNKKLAFLYQRYGLDNYSGVKLARTLNLPFVLEYNGSDIWINRNWGVGLAYEALSTKIEMLNLQAADLIVVVSQPMKDELTERGIEAAKILVNPNGVDPERYAPTINGTAIQTKYNLHGKIVIGFIGTFGPWHGAEKLAAAFGSLLRDYPELRENVRLLLIGDGKMRPEVDAAIASYGAENQTMLTGLVPQEDGPAYLAACDILASPHVPNADGTPFFGSPTKLFEYMAMGKGIVASDLDQIGEVLTHDKTAWMVPPGDVDALKMGLKTLIDDAALRERLGAAALQEVLQNYTWEAHTGRIIAALRERCA